MGTAANQCHTIHMKQLNGIGLVVVVATTTSCLQRPGRNLCTWCSWRCGTVGRLRECEIRPRQLQGHGTPNVAGWCTCQAQRRELPTLEGAITSTALCGDGLQWLLSTRVVPNKWSTEQCRRRLLRASHNGGTVFTHSVMPLALRTTATGYHLAYQSAAPASHCHLASTLPGSRRI